MFNSDGIQKPQSEAGLREGKAINGPKGWLRRILLEVATYLLYNVLTHLLPPSQPRQEPGKIVRASAWLTEGKLKWSTAASRYREAANGFVCFATPELDCLVCVETNSGKEVWKRRLRSHIAAYPIVSDTTVVYGDFDKMLCALDLQTGHEKWNLQMEHRIVTPGAIDNGRLWFGVSDGTYRSVDVETPDEMSVLDLEEFNTEAPSVSEQRVCFNWGSSFVVADSRSARLLWSPSFPGTLEVLMSPAIHRGIVYCHTEDGYLRAHDVEAKKEIWSHQVYQEWCTKVAVGSGMVFSRFSNNQIRAFDVETGEVRWTFDTEGTGVSAPGYSNGSVFIVSCGGRGMREFCLNAETGAPIWRFSLFDEEIDEWGEDILMELAFHAPLCDGGTALFNDVSGNLIAVGND